MEIKRCRICAMAIVWMLFGLMTTACAVRTPVERVRTPDHPDRLKNTHVVIREFVASDYVLNGEPAMRQCKQSALMYLSSKGLFKSVKGGTDEPPESSVLFVDAILVDLRLVSDAARFWGGFFAGRSHMKLMVEISDQKGNAIAQKELFGAPNAMGSAFSYGSSDHNLPYQMGHLLGDYVIVEADKIYKQ